MAKETEFQQTKPTPGRCAVAPYNFVPLNKQVVKTGLNSLPNHNKYYPQLLSGYLTVELETKTPLYIRAPLEEKKFKEGKESKDIPEFFYTDDKDRPVIPGSSLRGMLRSLIEIITWSKMGDISEEPLVFRAVGDTSDLGTHYREKTLGENQGHGQAQQYEYPSQNLKGGYLRIQGKKREIIPAKEFEGESFVHVDVSKLRNIRTTPHDWQKVYIKPASREHSHRTGHGVSLSLNLALTDEISDSPGNGLEKAALVISGHMGGRHRKHMHCAIYEEDEEATPLAVDEACWKKFWEDQTMQRGIENRKLGMDANDNPKNGTFPCFYLVDNAGELVFLGPTMLFRLPYEKSPKDLLPKGHRNKDSFDFTEAMFGFVGKNQDMNDIKQGDKQRAYRYRVSVCDGKLLTEEKDIWYSKTAVNPQILSSPKPTTFQHYLVQNSHGEKKLKHYDSKNTEPRGHKLYWHQPDKTPFEANQSEVKEHATQYTQICPLKSGVKFRFKIHFDNLFDYELGALCWALQPNGESGKEYCHKLGMAKPLGLGSVKLTPKLTIVNRKQRYKSLNGLGENHDTSLDAYIAAFEKTFLTMDGRSERFADKERIKELLKMMEFPGTVHQNKVYLDKHSIFKADKLKIYRERRILPKPTDVEKIQPAKKTQNNRR